MPVNHPFLIKSVWPEHDFYCCWGAPTTPQVPRHSINWKSVWEYKLLPAI